MTERAEKQFPHLHETGIRVQTIAHKKTASTFIETVLLGLLLQQP